MAAIVLVPEQARLPAPYEVAFERLQALYPGERVSFALRKSCARAASWDYTSGCPEDWFVDWPPQPGARFRVWQPAGELPTRVVEIKRLPSDDPEELRPLRLIVLGLEDTLA